MKVTIEGSTDSPTLETINDLGATRLADNPTKWLKEKPVSDSKLVEAMPLKGYTDKAGLILPPAVRWMSPDKKAVIFERPPFQHRVTYSDLNVSGISAYGKKKNALKEYENTFVLNIPWTCYAVVFNDNYYPQFIQAYMSNQPLVDDLNVGNHVSLPMPNIWNNARVCLAKLQLDNLPDTLVSGLHRTHAILWQSGFNFDLTESVAVSMANGLFGIACGLDHQYDATNYNQTVKTFFTEWEKFTPEQVLTSFFPTKEQCKAHGNGRIMTTYDKNKIIHNLCMQHDAMVPAATTQRFVNTLYHAILATN